MSVVIRMPLESSALIRCRPQSSGVVQIRSHPESESSRVIQSLLESCGVIWSHPEYTAVGGTSGSDFDGVIIGLTIAELERSRGCALESTLLVLSLLN